MKARLNVPGGTVADWGHWKLIGGDLQALSSICMDVRGGAVSLRRASGAGRDGGAGGGGVAAGAGGVGWG